MSCPACAKIQAKGGSSCWQCRAGATPAAPNLPPSAPQAAPPLSATPLHSVQARIEQSRLAALERRQRAQQQQHVQQQHVQQQHQQHQQHQHQQQQQQQQQQQPHRCRHRRRRRSSTPGSPTRCAAGSANATSTRTGSVVSGRSATSPSTRLVARFRTPRMSWRVPRWCCRCATWRR